MSGPIKEIQPQFQHSPTAMTSENSYNREVQSIQFHHQLHHSPTGEGLVRHPWCNVGELADCTDDVQNCTSALKLQTTVSIKIKKTIKHFSLLIDMTESLAPYWRFSRLKIYQAAQVAMISLFSAPLLIPWTHQLGSSRPK